MSGECIVAKLTNVRSHSNAERLKLATVAGFQIVVGLDQTEGEIGLFFDSEIALSDSFCRANDLYPRFDNEGKRVGGGFFDQKSRRVRAQSFRGEKSYGYWCSLSSLNNWV